MSEQSAEMSEAKPVSVSRRLGRCSSTNRGNSVWLQLADVQDGPKISKDTIALITAAIRDARPDLVVFSGNQIAGYDPAFAATFTKRRWKTAVGAAPNLRTSPTRASSCAGRSSRWCSRWLTRACRGR